MSAQPQPRLTAEQYLGIERAVETRSEYFNGRMYTRPHSSFKHVLITSNLSAELGIAIKKYPCMAAANALRIRVSPGGLHAYPDVLVICGEPQFADDQTDTILNPILIAEVLSPSTEAYDRGFKSAQYRTLESLQEYALVSQSEPRVEVFRRHSGETWILSEAIGLASMCRFDSLNCEIPLAEIYDKVSFEGEDPIAR